MQRTPGAGRVVVAVGHGEVDSIPLREYRVGAVWAVFSSLKRANDDAELMGKPRRG